MEGKVVSPADKPHFYVVETPTGKIERTRRHLHVVPVAESGAAESGAEVEGDTPASPYKLPTKVMTRSQTFASRQQPANGVMTHSQTAKLRDENIP